ncbi:hypothetical protein K3495_g283 [Podosphaera aphanis]|nr:hypothetical protein K3495_g283 [Podosphaera aphanis]
MAPSQPLPYSDEFKSADDYIDSLLSFSHVSHTFQTLCGGVHLLDFFTRDASLYHTVIPEEWRSWLMARDSMRLLDFLMRDDLDATNEERAPESLIRYVKEIRKHSLRRNAPNASHIEPSMPRHVAVGMIPKKVHEVQRFAQYVNQVADEVAKNSGTAVTHFIDFGSGQNYLGRTLASAPYNKHIIAVENREVNISGAENKDVRASFAKRETVMRNKKLYRQQQESLKTGESSSIKSQKKALRPRNVNVAPADLRPSRQLKAVYTQEKEKGRIQYVHHQVKDGDLANVVSKIKEMNLEQTAHLFNEVDSSTDESTVSNTKNMTLMAVSIHSCGNLSHHAIRSLLVNEAVHAIAIVGCCYNLLSERLSPPSSKHPLLRRNQRAINAPPISCEAVAGDPHGFPMSERIAKYGGDGIRLNITARMMAVQAPLNWTEKESDSFFTRHFYRALLQRIFLDRGIVSLTGGLDEGTPESTEPVIIGSLRKGSYGSFRAYVRGALEKLSHNHERGALVLEKMGCMTDEQIDEYIQKYQAQKMELSITWTLMAFSAGVAESLIVADRWLFLKEHPKIVKECWVEPIFNYQLSPRNLVVVGIKR